MSVWVAPMDAMAAQLSRVSETVLPPLCDEDALVAHAHAVLSNNFDVELGAVAPGSPALVGFQHLKTADALLAAQAIAHVDFDRAAKQFRRILSYQRHDGSLPLIVYGPSVDPSIRWFETDKTFYPGPAFWLNPNDTITDSTVSNGSTEGSREAESRGTREPTSSLMAPPIAADVALQMYRLSPYESTMGIVAHTTKAVEFLCDIYPTLRKLHHHIFDTRQGESGLLAAQHPWETFSPFSSHWKNQLSKVKNRTDYTKIVAEIPQLSKLRFSQGAVLEGPTADAIQDFYEPMMYLGSCFSGSTFESENDEEDVQPCRLNVFDLEFNTLALRSAVAFVDITRVLVDRSSACSKFQFEPAELLHELDAAMKQAGSLRDSITGNETTRGQMWNASAQIFNDDTNEENRIPSLRGVIPSFGVKLHEPQMMDILSHFLPSSDTFQFFCAKYPTGFFPCGSIPEDDQVSMLHYNYFLQRGFSMNGFNGLGMYIRNKTRDLVCQTNVGANRTIALAFKSVSGQKIGTFEDGYAGSSLSAGLLLNILLPAITSPPTPDPLPVDHRMLTVIMCVELVVAFGVALGCVFLSVYFVANRPRERGFRAANDGLRARRKRETRSNRSESVGMLSSGSESQVSFGSSLDLEEGLLSEDDDAAYGSFNNGHGTSHNATQQGGGTWDALREVLASISPW